MRELRGASLPQRALRKRRERLIWNALTCLWPERPISHSPGRSEAEAWGLVK
jgi:hypothetical protein